MSVVFCGSRQWQAETKVKRADGVNAGASVTTAAAGLHVTSRCAICGPSFEWVSCHKGMRLLLQADTGLNTSPCLYLLRVEREDGSIKGFTLQILIVFDTWRRCWTESRSQRKESQDFIRILGISLLWYFELVRKGFETPESWWICCLSVYVIWVSHESRY